MPLTRWIVASVACSLGLAWAEPITLTTGSLLVLQTGFPSGAIQQYGRTGTAGPTLALPVLGDIPESITVLDGQVYVGDGSGRVSLINPTTGAATTVFNTPNVALTSLGNYHGDLLALNEFGFPPNFPPSNTINVYSTTGLLLKSIILQSVPSGVEWNGITSDGSTIYIADFSMSGRIYKYSSTGVALGFIDTGLGSGLSGVSYDASNNSLWLSDLNTDTVYDYTTGGVLLSDFTTDISPASVAVIPESSTVPEPGGGLLALGGLLISAGVMRRSVR